MIIGCLCCGCDCVNNHNINSHGRGCGGNCDFDIEFFKEDIKRSTRINISFVIGIIRLCVLTFVGVIKSFEMINNAHGSNLALIYVAIVVYGAGCLTHL
jgi:hypothetical protein